MRHILELSREEAARMMAGEPFTLTLASGTTIDLRVAQPVQIADPPTPVRLCKNKLHPMTGNNVKTDGRGYNRCLACHAAMAKKPLRRRREQASNGRGQRFACVLCAAVFKKQHGLSVHKTRKHGSQKKITGSAFRRGIIKCHPCDIVFDTIADLNAHQVDEHGVRQSLAQAQA